MTLLLSQSDVETLLTPEVCTAAVEDALRRLAEGTVPAPGILGMQGGEGSFHVKAGFLASDRPYFAAKLNANFPHNAARHGLPTIQGVVVLSDATSGAPLALMDSMSITALRTAAATAVAAKHLAPRRCEAMLICGCGGQARAQLGEVVAGQKAGRTGEAEIIVFDSTGTGLQDVAAAIAVYKRALEARAGQPFSLSGR